MNKAIYTQNLEETIKYNKMIPDEKIFILAANLLKHNFFKLQELWAYLSPSDDDLMKSYAQRLENGMYFYKDSFFARVSEYSKAEKEER